MTDKEQFAQLMKALEPWLPQIVVIGGWAHRLYRFHPLSQKLDFPPLTTLDTDIAVPPQLPVADRDMRDRLIASGFTEEFMGEHQPPATHYRLGNTAGGFYAEFLTPLAGGNEDRHGRSTATVRIAGVTLQKLRYLELLLKSPWEVVLEPEGGFPLEPAMAVHVPNASSYLAQKVLIHKKRERREQSKNFMYIHDTIQTFGPSLERLRYEWEKNVKPHLHSKAAAEVAHGAEVLFREVTDVTREAAIQARAAGRNISPEEIQAVCYAGLQQVFTP